MLIFDIFEPWLLYYFSRINLILSLVGHGICFINLEPYFLHLPSKLITVNKCWADKIVMLIGSEILSSMRGFAFILQIYFCKLLRTSDSLNERLPIK